MPERLVDEDAGENGVKDYRALTARERFGVEEINGPFGGFCDIVVKTFENAVVAERSDAETRLLDV